MEGHTAQRSEVAVDLFLFCSVYFKCMRADPCPALSGPDQPSCFCIFLTGCLNAQFDFLCLWSVKIPPNDVRLVRKEMVPSEPRPRLKEPSQLTRELLIGM